MVPLGILNEISTTNIYTWIDRNILSTKKEYFETKEFLNLYSQKQNLTVNMPAIVRLHA